MKIKYLLTTLVLITILSHCILIYLAVLEHKKDMKEAKNDISYIKNLLDNADTCEE